MYTTESTNREFDAQLKRARNRERIAQCKLDRLKERFDRLQGEMTEAKWEAREGKREASKLKEELVGVRAEKDRLEQEASMWRAQLFERMEMLDKTKARLQEVTLDLKDARAQAARAAETRQASHEELRRRDKEKKAYELRIEELKMAHQESREQSDELLSALSDAEQAIQSLQRASDFHQREIVGLKSIGAGLTENLTRMTHQRDRYKERLDASLAELRLEQAESAHLLGEVERLRDELYETKARLMTFQIESDVREMRRAGAEKSARAQEEKHARPPAVESSAALPQPRSLLSRATKKVSGWFKMSDGVS